MSESSSDAASSTGAQADERRYTADEVRELMLSACEGGWMLGYYADPGAFAAGIADAREWSLAKGTAIVARVLAEPPRG